MSTDHSPPLPDFQEQAAQLAFRRLTDGKKAPRFLLADEVGLGKTHIAARVIELLEKKLRRPAHVAYICSNQAIVRQNQSRLGLNSDVRRATDLAMKHRRPARAALTPGTSLSGGTGTGRERALLLVLVNDLLRLGRSRRGPTAAWRRFFQGAVQNEHAWIALLASARQRSPYSPALCRRIKHEWAHQPAGSESLAHRAAIEVLRFERERKRVGKRRTTARRRANELISQLRSTVQRACIEWLNPDLVILDEVQRFREILNEDLPKELHAGKAEGKQPTHREMESYHALALTLFGRRTRVLMLSATPWEALSLKGDRRRHERELKQTLAFLLRSGEEAEESLSLLREFNDKIEGQERRFLLELDESLRSTKLNIQQRLRRVMSRTERSWFSNFEDCENDRPSADAQPTEEEIQDCVRLATFMRAEAGAAAMAIEQWKACPSPLTFLDRGYKAFRTVCDRPVPDGLVTDPARLHELGYRNYRMRELVGKLRNSTNGPWRHLWVMPTLRYYHSDFCATPSPPKLLIFSAWRFVPGAIAAVLSAIVDRTLGIEHGRLPKQHGFAFRAGRGGRRSVLDVCMPSELLADAVNPLQGAREDRDHEILVQQAEQYLREKVAQQHGKIVLKGGISRWEFVARLENLPKPSEVADAGWKTFRQGLGSVAREVYPRPRKSSGEDRPLRVSSKELHHLAQVAAFSPAVSMLRSLRLVRRTEHKEADLALAIWVGLEMLRRYFDRVVNQRIVKGVVPSGSYTSRVLEYCRDAQIQAMLDEYLHLLSGSDRDVHPLKHLARALGLEAGDTHINERGKHGRLIARRARVHIARAFAQESGNVLQKGSPASSEDSHKGQDLGSTAAASFNSPFWPFVLATTSVGQEGLDFHCYCSDIVHWNLPLSPVAFEQREGRITRRRGFSLRHRVADEWRTAGGGLGSLPSDRNPWDAMFEQLAKREPHFQTYGLYPDWLLTDERGKRSINRHLFFYAVSNDEERYRLLNNRLLTYRLAFGQPDQELVLDVLREKMEGLNEATVRKLMPAYWVNLSPIREPFLRSLALRRGRALLCDRQRLEDDWRRICELVEAHPILQRARRQLEKMKDLLDRHVNSGGTAPPAAIEAAAAFWYLLHPFDLECDAIAEVGFDDDVHWIAHASARSRTRS
jgi:hypothetical protein